MVLCKGFLGTTGFGACNGGIVGFGIGGTTLWDMIVGFVVDGTVVLLETPLWDMIVGFAVDGIVVLETLEAIALDG